MPPRKLPAQKLLLAAVPFALSACGGEPRTPRAPEAAFAAVQPELFSTPGAQPNAWADYDNDGDLDLFVGFRGGADRLYRNDGGAFSDVAPEVGLADAAETRAAAWGDFDGDGDLDLYVGYPVSENRPNRLYRNDGNGSVFTDVAAEVGLSDVGTTRQPVWVDYDQDGDVDLFVAFRDRENQLYRNDGARFVNVTEETGIGDPRRTVGVVWFDMDTDGDLDLFVANQNGDQDGFFRNDAGAFTDVAPELGMAWPERGDEYGSVGPAVADYDRDGDLDLFIATYGPDVLWQNQGDGTFVNVAPGTPLSPDHHSTTAAWGDVDNDGWPDLYVAAYLGDAAEEPDDLFRNVAGGFEPDTPAAFLEAGASHGVAWADYDGDGDLDLALANNHAEGHHPLYRNELDPAGGLSLQVMVRDGAGRPVLAGAEVRVFDGDGTLLGTGLVDAGGGYCSQGAAPVFLGLGAVTGPVRVEVTTFRGGARVTTATEADPARLRGRWLEVRVD
ncbi:MAG TPA: CRTAC1 family protein [Longimicrobiales bacterium]|nr:CRTAC1 family protein [Longimicrobiales bacterium]